MVEMPFPVTASPGILIPADRRSTTAALVVLATLLKVRIVAVIVFTGVATAWVATRGQVTGTSLFFFALAGCLGASGAAVLNHYLDRGIDARMARTRERPLPTGQIPPALARVLGLGLIASSLPAAWSVHPVLPLFIVQGVIVYVVVYTWWLKPRTPHSVVIGGWAGSCAVLGGWAMTGEPLSLVAWALAALVFVWTPPHFWCLAIVRGDDYRAAGIPTLPAVAGNAVAAKAIAAGAALTLLVSLVPWVSGDLGPVYGGVALLGGATFLASALALCRQQQAALAWRAYKLSGPYLGVLFLALLVDVAMR